MKKLICMLPLFLLLTSTHAQVKSKKDRSTPMTEIEQSQFYKKKSKEQRTIGWLLVGLGVTLYAVTAINVNEDLSKVNQTAILGTASLISSIPVFIFSGKNKRKAELLLKQSSIPMNQESKKNNQIRSIGIGIPLGK